MSLNYSSFFDECLFLTILNDKIEGFDDYKLFIIETRTDLYENIDKLIDSKKYLFYPKNINKFHVKQKA